MNRHVRAVSLAAFATSILCSAQAYAVTCTAPEEARQYSSGLLKGKSLVDMSWKSTGINQECKNFDRLEDRVLYLFQIVLPPKLPGTTPSEVMCWYQGEFDGAKLELQALGGQCDTDCGAEGTAIGEMAAFMYCFLSEEFNGLGLDIDLNSAPSNKCSLAFEPACQTSFATNTAADPLCVPYGNSGTFLPVWTQFSRNQCLYEALPTP